MPERDLERMRRLREKLNLKTGGVSAPPPAKARAVPSAAKVAASGSVGPPPHDPQLAALRPKDNVLASYLARKIEDVKDDASYLDIDPSNLVIGLRLPALSLRYLFLNDVIPLGRVIQLLGRTGSLKSALVYEFARWTLAHGGLFQYLECENKDAPDLRASILENRPEWYLPPNRGGRTLYVECGSSQDWQSAIVECLDAFDAAYAVKGGGHVFTDPLLIGLDSFAGSASTSVSDAVAKAGFAEAGFGGARNAAELKTFLQTQNHRLRNKPIILVGTNHLLQRIGQTMPGRPPEEYAPGGRALEHVQTMTFKLQKIAGIKKLTHGGVRLKIRLIKNGLGPADRAIEVECLWKYEVNSEGEQRQRTFWDWHAASIGVLLAQQKESVTTWNKIQEIVDIHPTTQGRAWSRELGFPKDSPVKLTELGRALEAREDLLEALYPVLYIKRRTAFQPGVDFEAQVEAAARGPASAIDIYPPIDFQDMAYISDELDEKAAQRGRSGFGLGFEHVGEDDDE
jgi:hypothetical protein